MASPVTVRLDKKTRDRIARIARHRRVSASRVIREAIDAWVERPEVTGSPYEAVADLMGIVHGGNPSRSTDVGRAFKDLLIRRRTRS